MAVYVCKIWQSSPERIQVALVESSHRAQLLQILAKQGKMISTKRLIRPWKFQDKIEFWRSLESLLKGHMRVHECLDIMSQSLSTQYLRLMSKSIVEMIRSGQNFSSSCKKFPGFFSFLDLSLLEVAEASGTLGAIVRDIALAAQAWGRHRQRMMTACVYPLTIIAVTSCFIAFLAWYLSSHLLWMEGEPKVSSSHLSYIFGTIGLLFLLLGVGVFLFKARKIGQSLLMYLMKIQILGSQCLSLYLKRWFYSMSILLSHHVSLLDSLRLCAPLIRKEEADVLWHQIFNGSSLSRALVKSFPRFPAFFLGQIHIGEKTGALGTSFHFISNQVTDLENVWLERFQQYVHPLGMLIAGLLLLALVMDLIAPFYSLIQGVQ